MSDLVERLRSAAYDLDWRSHGLVNEAADRIRELEAALSAIADGEGDAQEIARQTLNTQTGQPNGDEPYQLSGVLSDSVYEPGNTQTGQVEQE
jgi:hypothetical protein